MSTLELNQFVSPVVMDEEGHKITRSMRRTDQRGVLTHFYHEMVPAAHGVFLYDRRRIIGDETPEELGMKDGAKIQFLPDITPDRLVTPVLQDFTGRCFTRTMLKTDRLRGLMDFCTTMVPGYAVASDGDGGSVFL